VTKWFMREGLFNDLISETRLRQKQKELAMWYANRFNPDEKKMRFDCVVCGRSMFFPASKHGKYLTCGDQCAVKKREIERDGRTRDCLTCGKSFTPRKFQLDMGIGKYCCQKCNPSHLKMNAPEPKSRAIASFKLAIKTGSYKPASGENNPNWKGGKDASMLRLKQSGKRAEITRRYRANNPEKVREFSRRRGERKIGILPKGTVKKIGLLQKWKCTICFVSIKETFHVDHIEPLAKGGRHEPSNIQLLCPTCNVRKASKDPISYMQERGFLL
jgi:5-methylcytosine-specific restriction endonuclease McrA